MVSFDEKFRKAIVYLVNEYDYIYESEGVSRDAIKLGTSIESNC